jgi:Zn finger protein HypA/HybF involved in hydrogenase expression
VDEVSSDDSKRATDRAEISCAECERTWDDARARWRAYLTVDEQTVVYCPDCAKSEFDNF